MTDVDTYRANVWMPRPAAFFERRGLSHSTVERFGLGYTADHGKGRKIDLRDCLVIPYEDGLGRIRQLRYRPLGDCSMKYITVAGESPHLFAVRATDNHTVYVCEGEIDTMSAWQAGLKAVGIPGASTWRDEWRWLFRNATRVILALDPDEAGVAAARRVHQSLQSVVTVEIVQLPEGYDVNDLLVKHGEEGVLEVLSG